MSFKHKTYTQTPKDDKYSERGKADADWPSGVCQLRRDIKHQDADTIVSSHTASFFISAPTPLCFPLQPEEGPQHNGTLFASG